MDFLPVKRALISVTDKSNIVELASFLQNGGVEIISTGGTKKLLESSGIKVVSVSEVTGFPEILGGRVKTLHPHIHAGVLADKDNSDHMETLQKLNIKPFDVICVNLYDFKLAVEKGLKGKDLVEQIDIGGPTLLRAGAKNFHSIVVLPNPSFYDEFISELKKNDFKVGIDFRKKTAMFTFEMISNYDLMIAKAFKELM